MLSEAIEIVANPDNVIDAGEEGERPSELPFSKARCIALVLTVTGASFLNVSLLIPLHHSQRPYQTLESPDNVGAVRGDHFANGWSGLRHS